jgi:hypothetical protein
MYFRQDAGVKKSRFSYQACLIYRSIHLKHHLHALGWFQAEMTSKVSKEVRLII